ncbi:hypothetical protein KKI43_16495 [Arthrobacter sp. GN70]|uniref:Uncharacterized protein n=1 Tax=Arthrobacter terricola TaxID=2547396 RepID=A0A4R5KGT6_9MICC|nr:hypothetical protein [Arthrobacter sp. GN70]TDF94573.1 hypothetical protein E1809_13565 [Arthrobacter terricola]
MIGLDADMQLDSIGVVTDCFEGSLEPFQLAILDGLYPDRTRFFAIAHPGIWDEDHCFDHQPVVMEGNRLAKAASARGFRMIGHFGIDETGYRSVGPPSYFDQYPLGDDLPSTMPHWVHSKFGKSG